MAVAALAAAGSLAALPSTAHAQSGRSVTGYIRAGLSVGDHGSPVKTLQGDLWDLGYNPGPVDGIYGPRTRAALAAFQGDHGLAASGQLTSATFSALLKAGNWTSVAVAKAATTLSTTSAHGKSVQMVATAYGPNLIDNYPYGPVDYFGAPLRAGDVAVDPHVIPLGTHLWISGYSSPDLPAGGFAAVARDTGGAIKGNRVDIFIDAPRGAVSKFGIQNVKVTILGK